jgi:hypothetical protein
VILEFREGKAERRFGIEMNGRDLVFLRIEALQRIPDGAGGERKEVTGRCLRSIGKRKNSRSCISAMQTLM